MALGKAGSSLTAELNRLAGITDVAKYLDEQGAAKHLEFLIVFWVRQEH